MKAIILDPFHHQLGGNIAYRAYAGTVKRYDDVSLEFLILMMEITTSYEFLILMMEITTSLHMALTYHSAEICALVAVDGYKTYKPVRTRIRRPSRSYLLIRHPTWNYRAYMHECIPAVAHMQACESAKRPADEMMNAFF